MASGKARRARPGEEKATTLRTETEYRLMVDYIGPCVALASSHDLPLGTTEHHALEEARTILLSLGVWRVEIFAREVPVEWTKVEEIRR